MNILREDASKVRGLVFVSDGSRGADKVAESLRQRDKYLSVIESVEARLSHWEERFTGSAPDEVAMRAAIYLIRQDIQSALEDRA